MRPSITLAIPDNTEHHDDLRVLAERYYGNHVDDQRLFKIHKRSQDIVKKEEYLLKQKESNVDELLLTSANILKEHINYNFNKTTNQKQHIPIREKFKHISNSLHNQCDEFELLSQKVIFRQAYYADSKTFLFQGDIESANQVLQRKDTKLATQSSEQGNSPSVTNYSYKTPNGQKFNINLQQNYDMKKVAKELKQRYEGEELRVSQNKMTTPLNQTNMGLTIDSIYNFKEEIRQDRHPQDLTKELMSSFVDIKDFTETLAINETGDFILGPLEQQTFIQLAKKRDQILSEDILERGQIVTDRQNDGNARGAEQLNRDLYLIFNDPQVVHDIEDTQVDRNNLRFQDMTSFLADRLKPDQILEQQRFNSFNGKESQFDSFSPYDESKTHKAVHVLTQQKLTSDSFAQTDSNNLRKYPIPHKDETTIQQYSLFQKIQKEVNQIKAHKVRYQSDNFYLQQLNSHILEKLNQLWKIVREFEKEFEKYDTISQSIEVIYQYVFNLKGRHTQDGNTKAEVLLWIMKEFKEICQQMAEQGLQLVQQKKDSHPIIKESTLQVPQKRNTYSNNSQRPSQALNKSLILSRRLPATPLTRESSTKTLKKFEQPHKTTLGVTKLKQSVPSSTARTTSNYSINPSRTISPLPQSRKHLLEHHQQGSQYSPFKPISQKIKEHETNRNKIPLKRNIH